MLLADMMRIGNEASEKSLSDDRVWSNHPMMWGTNSQAFWGIHAVLALITWIAILAVLIALARWLWKKGDSEKKGR